MTRGPTTVQIAFANPPAGGPLGRPTNRAGASGPQGGHQLRAFQVFAAGAWQPRGATAAINFDPQMVAIMAAVYAPETYTATLHIGKPNAGAPTQGLGNVRQLIAVDGALFAIASVAPQLIAEVRARRLTSVAASFFNPGDSANPVPGSLYLQHVEFLDPIARPIVTGMQPPAFASQADMEPACFAAPGYSVPDTHSDDAVMFAVAKELEACSGGAIRFIEAATHVQTVIRAR